MSYNARNDEIRDNVTRGWVLVLAFCLVLGCNGTSEGMEITKKVVSAGTVIKATGPIMGGDAAKLESLVREATVDEKGLRRIILESPGGEVVEAVRIAEIIRNNNFVTLVGGECASACAMVLYPAGRHSYLIGQGKLGFHSCYDRQLVVHPECTEAIAKIAASFGFPYGSIKVFASLKGPAEMYWITNVVAYCYGLEHLIGDPAPISVSTLCPKVYQALIDGKFQEPDRPLGPSFDCRKAITAPEHLLCRDPELMHLDALMGKLYRMMRKREGGGVSQLLSTQRAWISERDQKCVVSTDAVSSYEKSRDAAQCFSEMTMARMDKLLGANGTPRLDLSPLTERMKKEEFFR
jgi:uncharacterized protein YecT (DUF1311 family)